MGILLRLRRAWRHGRIATRLTVFAVLMVLLGLVVRITIIPSILESGLQSVLAAQQLSIATYVARDIEERIGERLGLLERLAAGLHPALFSDPPALRAWLETSRAAFPLFSRGLVLVPADGKAALAGTPVLPGRCDPDFHACDWFQAVRKDRAPFIGAPERRGEIVIAVPVPDGGGGLAGVLAGAVAVGAPGFLDILQESRIAGTGGFLLLSPRDRMIVTATDPGEALKSLPAPNVNALYDQAVAGYRGTARAAGPDGAEELSAIVPVPTPGWVLVARLPAAEAFASVAEVRKIVIVSSLLTALGVALFVGLSLLHLFRPLAEAARQMRGMAEGTVALEPLPVVRLDEVGDLALGFNHLLEKLRENEAALRRSEARMAHMAHHDALSGLPNRAMFEDRLFQAIARAERHGTEFALLFIDLDGFKPVNDCHGHRTGDAVLRQVAERLASVMRKADFVARIGGDEFAVLLEEEEAARGARTVALKLREALAQPILVDGLSLRIGLSIGIATYPRDGRTEEQLLAAADGAMYVAKRGGRTV